MHSYIHLQPYRFLNPYEESIIKRILSVEFQGAEDLRRQLPFIRVSEECQDCPSIVFEIANKEAITKANVNRTIPIEAEAKDIDSVIIHFLIYVNKGYLSEIEIYREDLGRILQLPFANDLEVFTVE